MYSVLVLIWFVKLVLEQMLRHWLKHVSARCVLEQLCGHKLWHLAKHVPDRHVLARYVPKHKLARHVIGLEKYI